MIRGKLSAIRTLLRDRDFRERPLLMSARLAIWIVRKWLSRQQWVTHPAAKHIRIALPCNWSAMEWYLRPDLQPVDPELAWLVERLNPGMVVADIGANLGVWTTLLADAVGTKGRVVAFEPTAVTANLLAKTVSKNSFPQINIVRAALSDELGTATIYHREGLGGNNSLGANDASRYQVSTGTSEQVAMTTLDEYMDSRGLARLDAMKIDVEGNEERVLTGALQTIRHHLPIIIFEATLSHAEQLGLAADGAWKLLRNEGYHTFTLSDDGEMEPLERFEKRGGGLTWWNVVAAHPENKLTLGMHENSSL